METINGVFESMDTVYTRMIDLSMGGVMEIVCVFLSLT